MARHDERIVIFYKFSEEKQAEGSVQKRKNQNVRQENIAEAGGDEADHGVFEKDHDPDESQKK